PQRPPRAQPPGQPDHHPPADQPTDRLHPPQQRTCAPSPPSSLVTNSTNNTVKTPWATAAMPFTTNPHRSPWSPTVTRSPSTHSRTNPVAGAVDISPRSSAS